VILAEPIKSRSGGDILRDYTKLFKYLQQRGFKPRTHWLDNKAPTALKDYNNKQGVDFQLVPPNMHRRNAAERAIRTWKNRFTAGLCSADPAFPLHLWTYLVEQATITINLLSAPRRDPQVSAYSILEGQFNFNATPMAPLGTKVLIHEKPQKRGSWDPRGVEGWYLGPARQHYRCYQVFAIKTKAIRITDTVEFFPTKTKIPYTTPTDVAIQAADDLIQVVQQK
jgi:hypothetical protein